ncbi:MBL fold metallo-hydrolase [Chitinophaga sp. CB10]|uniref:MBL fold metallo-hydrolase n=1 Tax=Chitinophaga sp. CB10 TaxID=1891659 RepID=UPI000AE75855|nr:MBL fold metallo-hydrolase [Chitinophaga sp. CB10]
MSLYITSLNSGSNGNCYYIGNDTDAILVDAGISCRETEKRMARLGLSMSKVRAIFVSHEHIDHIRGIPVMVRKHQLPVYITASTMQHGGLDIHEALVRRFTAFEPVTIGDLQVTAFPKFHDAIEPHSFMVSAHGVNIGVFTDIGVPCDQLIHHFKQCHAAFLEANYDEVMLEQGRYPYFLKNRIRGGHGHLSNTQALELFRAHRPAHMSHLLLAHLSKDNNNPELVHRLFTEEGTPTEIVVASRYAETGVYRISASNV